MGEQEQKSMVGVVRRERDKVGLGDVKGVQEAVGKLVGSMWH